MFLFSNMSSNDSNSRSKDIIRKGVVVVDKVFHKNMDKDHIERIVIKLNYPFRKICHFTEYFILSILILLSLRLGNISTNKSIIITFIFCFIFSISDEIHQMFIAGRSPLILDCFIDILGCSLFLLIYYFRTKKLS